MHGFTVIDEPLTGVFILDNPYHDDDRGDFSKIFNSQAFNAMGLKFNPKESFLTRSSKNVLRGMHFQIGNAAHDKLVYCIRGSVLDVVVDTRPASKNFNKPISLELSQSNRRSLYISKGYAHGFLSLEDESWLLYSTSTIYQPQKDRGVLWSSVDFDWPIKTPILSHRDSTHPQICTLQ